MAKNRPINSDFWIDEYIESININGRYLFLYLLTNPDCHISGIYRTTLKRIASDTGLEKDDVDSLLKEFSENDKVYFKDGNIIIVNFLTYQKPNVNMFKSIKKQIENLSDSTTDFLIENNTKLFCVIDKCVKELIKSTIKDLKEFESIYKALTKPLKGFSNPLKAFERLLISISKNKNENINKDQNKNLSCKKKDDTKGVGEKSAKKLQPNKKVLTITDFFLSIAPDWIDKELFSEFIIHRREIKKPLTELAVKKNITVLKKIIEKGFSQKEVIERTIANSWQGFFEPNNKQEKQGKQESPLKINRDFSDADYSESPFD